MRLIGKLLALPFMLVTGILYLVCKFLVVLSGAVLGILSGIIFLAALVLFFVAGFLPGLAWLMIAFLTLISVSFSLVLLYRDFAGS